MADPADPADTADAGDPPDRPLAIAVAPNGARRTKADHPALPTTAEELGATAAACLDAGAAMIHLHVRDAEGRHSLDPSHYARAIDQVRHRVGDRLVVQATSESGGRYGPQEQLDAMRAVHPETLSLAVREAIGSPEAEAPAADFLQWARQAGIRVQYILYDADDARRLADLHARKVVPEPRPWVLYVLGSYAQGRDGRPGELARFVDPLAPPADPWMVCAFGAREAACGLSAAALGGDVRVGFENNLHLPDGRVADDNAGLVANLAAGARAIGRPLADAAALRARLAALG